MEKIWFYKFKKHGIADYLKMSCLLRFFAYCSFIVLFAGGCAHYTVNPPLDQYDPDAGYRSKNKRIPGSLEELGLYLTFSGGGTRAAAFSYGVLEELKNTEITIKGKKRRLLDEVEAISGVSGGSFTAAYFGLFGDRIFEDYEEKFLNKNVQGAILRRTLFNPYNWIRLMSTTFTRSDIATEYYDKYVFEGGTFGDIAAREGPMIMINATDMVSGIRLGFNQGAFDVLCSDLSGFPVARAAAASSAVPGILTPITLRNYAGSCGFKMPEQFQKVLEEQDTSSRQFHHLNDILPYMDAKKKRYIHLVDGGVSDNLGLRAVLDIVVTAGDFWTTIKHFGFKNIHKLVFIVVNAETEVGGQWSLFDKSPTLGAMLGSYSSIAITRYNFETIMLLRESFNKWTEDVQKNRCGSGPISTEPGACGDIKFYLIELKFDYLKDEAESSYLKRLPTSFKLSPEQVDRLRKAAGQLLKDSPDFQRLLGDVRQEMN